MKRTSYVFVFLLSFCFACKDRPVSYTVSLDKDKSVTGTIWKKGEANSFYTDLYVTEQYYIFSEYESDTVLQVFDKTNPVQYVGFDIKRGNTRLFLSIDFVKSNSRYISDKEDIWYVENKQDLKQVRLQNDSLIPVNTWSLPRHITRSTNYNFTKEELYAVPTKGSLANTFYFFHPDSGYYWVGMHGIIDKIKYRKNPYAFLSNLIVNEEQNAVACAFLFFNQIQFFDLRGNLIRSVTVGEEDVMPVNKRDGSLDYENSTKCFIDICSTNRHVYCLYDGTKDFDETSRILVFNWNGTHVKTYHVDRILKKIAVDESNKMLVALASNDDDGRDVVCYPIK